MSRALVSTRFPYLPFRLIVSFSKGDSLQEGFDALVDTGFSGDVVIPVTDALRRRSADAYATWTMADGSEVMAPLYLGSVHFPELEGEAAELAGITVTVLGDQPLIGLGVLKHFQLTLDHGKRLVLEP